MAALLFARRDAESQMVDLAAATLMAVGAMLLRKIAKRWDREDEPSPGGMAPKATSDGGVRAPNQPIRWKKEPIRLEPTKKTEGSKMNLPREVPLSLTRRVACQEAPMHAMRSPWRVH